MTRKDLAEHASNQLTESLTYNCKGFMEVSEIVSAINDEEPEFDGDSYCPYYSQQVDVINDYEREFGNDAEEICGEQTYSASDWQQAQTAYAYAIAYVGFNSYFNTAKYELIEALEEFESDVESELHTDTLDMDDVVKVELSSNCTHGWAAHNRELEDGTMIWESGQLDGCNGMAKKLADGLWVSCCLSPKVNEN